MITIYCLVDPRNNKPFYVGATKIKLKHRICGHIHDAMGFRTNEHAKPFTNYKKHFLIQELIELGLRPRIDYLYTCTIKSADFYEMFFHDMLIAQGFELFNWKHRICYSQYSYIDNYQKNKNTSIIIWYK